MSSREPLWFCHECQAEMRPLMVPDPVCASCRGSFVEKIENPQDDPREFMHIGDDDGQDHIHGGAPLDFLFNLSQLLDRGMAPPGPSRNRPDGTPAAPRLSFQFIGSNGGSRSMSIGGGGGAPAGYDGVNARPVPTMSDFLRDAPPGPDGQPRISSQLMLHYLLAMLQSGDPGANPFRGLGGIPENGRMGDYVFNQEALDEIITQIMENSNAHRPVPATEDIINKLPREVLTVESVTLTQDCAVCKDQFSLETEDPDEQIVVTLPCKHPFHQPCIIPWLKSSGTCPVCRYALVPQPSHSSSQNSPRDSTERPSSPPTQGSSSRRSPPPQDRESGGGLIHNIISHLTGNHLGSTTARRNGSGGTSSSPASPPNSHRRSGPEPYSRQDGAPRYGNDHVPGGWENDLD